MRNTSKKLVAELIARMGQDGLLKDETVSELIDAFEQAGPAYEIDADEEPQGSARKRAMAYLAGDLSELIMEERLRLEGEEG
jgi:hypothetical protein